MIPSHHHRRALPWGMVPAGWIGGLAMAVAVIPSVAGADPADFEVTGRVPQSIPADGDLDPTGSMTSIDATKREGHEESVGEIVREIPGARASALGALGSPEFLTVRGAAAEQTTVLFADIPLDSVDGGPFDLSTIPTAAVGQIELYRGAAPLWLGSGAIGGVLRLVPRAPSDDEVLAGAGLGAFGYRTAFVLTSLAEGPRHPGWLGAVGFRGADGDFVYDYDNTPLIAGDSREARRTNADSARGHGLFRWTKGALGGDL
ncbi:MAG: TonB-dependent receptor plug domain-containing protein, partial [Myxococcales bacterium]|nr:TonB-dependent receptor plug domain-containing protein [Myxococcales bacterium]